MANLQPYLLTRCTVPEGALSALQLRSVEFIVAPVLKKPMMNEITAKTERSTGIIHQGRQIDQNCNHDYSAVPKKTSKYYSKWFTTCPEKISLQLELASVQFCLFV